MKGYNYAAKERASGIERSELTANEEMKEEELEGYMSVICLYSEEGSFLFYQVICSDGRRGYRWCHWRFMFVPYSFPNHELKAGFVPSNMRCNGCGVLEALISIDGTTEDSYFCVALPRSIERVALSSIW